MPDSSKSSSFAAVAAPVVRAKAYRLAGRLGLRQQDIQDLEQDLWVGLLTRWEADRERSRGEDALRDAWEEHLSVAAMHRCVVHQIDQVAAAFAQSSVQDHVWPAREHPLIPWRESDQPAEPADGLRHLRLDLACILDRLPADLRRLCERLLCDGLDAAHADGEGVDRADLDRQIAALRHIFQTHDLHEYL